MARLTSEGKVKIYKVPTIVNQNAPTAAEVTAGTNLTPYLPTAGVEINWTQNNATLPMLDESFTVSAVGTESAEITLTGVRDDTLGTDLFWSAFSRGENFFLVVGRFGSANVIANRVEVYRVQSHRPVPLSPAENEFQQVQVKLGVTATPSLNATVA
jgi:hypothetical protein